MTSVMFVVPAHGRFELTRVCLRQLRRTCDELAGHDVRASALVVADDENLDTARECGFGTVERANTPLGRKWNDGYQLACDPSVNPHPADWAVPFGSDDWIDTRLVLAQVERRRADVQASRLSCVVREDGEELCPLRIGYDGGDGVRFLHRDLLALTDYRPAEEDRNRALDTSVFRNVAQRLGRMPRVAYVDLHPLQIVDFKSPDEQLNTYANCLAHREGDERRDPWFALAFCYPPEAIREARALYAHKVAA